MSDRDWKSYAKGLLKSELAKRNVNYIELAARLDKIGVHENSQNLSNKIARGSFSAVFMLQVLHVLGSDRLSLFENDSPIEKNV